MKKSIKTSIVFVVLCFLSLLSQAEPENDKLLVLTEKTPITYRSSENITDGQATQLVQELINEAKLTYDLYYIPWKRAYRRAELEKNIIIYPLARTPERESYFNWVGRITPVHYYLFRLKTNKNIQLNSILDVDRYRVGVVNFHANHLYLKLKGVKNLQLVNSNRQNFRKIIRGRLDLFASSSAGLLTLCEQEKIDCGIFSPAFELKEASRGLYVAASKKTSERVVLALRNAFDRLRSNGRVKAILKERENDQDSDRFLEHFL